MSAPVAAPIEPPPKSSHWILIIGGFLLFLIILAIIGVLIYLAYRYFSSSSTPTCTGGSVVNGQACTNPSDCASCNCSNNLCQPAGKTSGTSGASCTLNSQCNSPLTCVGGQCATINPSLTPNGFSCTVGTECQSGFCSSGFCQNSSTPTGTPGSNCAHGAPCNSGTCGTDGTCSGSSSNCGLLANGTACSLPTDCASCNCSQNYCQPTNVTTTYIGASCSGSGATCAPGLICQQGVCSLDNSLGGLAAQCWSVTGVTGGCQIQLQCQNIITQEYSPTGTATPYPQCSPGQTYSNQIGTTGICYFPTQLAYCSYPSLATGAITSSQAGVCPPGQSNINGQCLANSQQMCNLLPAAGGGSSNGATTSQCITGTSCAASASGNWYGWSMSLANGNALLTRPTWTPLPTKAAVPGPIVKVVVYQQSGADVIRALVSGSNGGIWDYFTTGTYGGTWQRRCGTSSFCTNVTGSGGSVSNFAVSRDSTVSLVAFANLTGNYSTPWQASTQVNYTGVFKVSIGSNGLFTNCTSYITGYPTGYTVANGMILGSYMSATQTATPSNWSSTDLTKPALGAPYQYILDMDVDATANYGLMLLGVAYNGTQTASANYAYFPTPMPGTTNGSIYNPGSGQLPLPLPQNGSLGLSNYCSCAANCTLGGLTTCGNPAAGIVKTNAASACGSSSSLQDGYCYVQPWRFLRSVNMGNNTFVLKNNGASTSVVAPIDNWAATFTNGNTSIQMPAILANLRSNNGQYNRGNYYGSVSELVLGAPITAAAVNYYATPGNIPYIYSTFPNTNTSFLAYAGPSFWILDYDINYANSSQAIMQYTNTILLVQYPTSQDVAILYFPNIMAKEIITDGAFGAVNGPAGPVNLAGTNLGGYVSAQSRVALGANAIYVFGPTSCQ